MSIPVSGKKHIFAKERRKVLYSYEAWCSFALYACEGYFEEAIWDLSLTCFLLIRAFTSDTCEQNTPGTESEGITELDRKQFVFSDYCFLFNPIYQRGYTVDSTAGAFHRFYSEMGSVSTGGTSAGASAASEVEQVTLSSEIVTYNFSCFTS